MTSTNIGLGYSNRFACITMQAAQVHQQYRAPCQSLVLSDTKPLLASSRPDQNAVATAPSASPQKAGLAGGHIFTGASGDLHFTLN